MKTCIYVLLLVVAIPLIASAQNPSASFEVASVKPNHSVDTGWSIGCSSRGRSERVPISPGKCMAHNVSILRIIAQAYALPLFTADQYVSGLPGWAKTERYDLDAKAESASASDGELKVMLQNLLADRFNLQLHDEHKQVSGYALIVGKGGLRSRPPLRDLAGQARTSKPIPIACGSQTTADLANCLSGQLGEPVVNKTNITQTGDFYLTTESLGWGQQNPPSIFTVVEEQLGLKLERQNVPRTILVIDHVERPSEN
jgi:uncharacterized protein (TIGR03435 family)